MRLRQKASKKGRNSVSGKNVSKKSQKNEKENVRCPNMPIQEETTCLLCLESHEENCMQCGNCKIWAYEACTSISELSDYEFLDTCQAVLSMDMPSKKSVRRRKKLTKPRKLVKARDEDPVRKEARLRKREAFAQRRADMMRRVSEDLTKKAEERKARKALVQEARRNIWAKELRDSKRSSEEKKMAQIRDDMKTIISAGVERVDALKIMDEKLKLKGSVMRIGNRKYKLKKNVHLVGWGRETLMLGAAVERILGNRLKKGLLVVPRGSLFGMWDTPLLFPKLDTRIKFFEGGTDGLPDRESVEATRKIANYCKKLKKSDILVVILSSGTRDLLCYPKPGIQLEELLHAVKILRLAGASKSEIDIVFGKTSAVSSGELARIAHRAKVITLVMSNVPGDPPQLIASSPTVHNPATENASSIVEKYDLLLKMPPSIVNAVAVRMSSGEPIPPTAIEKHSMSEDYHVIASISDAIEGMATAVFKLGLVPVRLGTAVQGNVREVSLAYCQIACLLILAAEEKINKVELYDAMKDNRILPLTEDKVREIFPSRDEWGLGLCLLMGGRPSVDVTGNGKGGPSQELALYFSLDWYLKVKQYPILKEYVVWLLAGSTNGSDGNTKFAGAYGYGSLAAGVYKHHNELATKEREMELGLRKLTRTDPDSEVTLEATKAHSDLVKETAKVSAILPDQVLKNNNTNHMFMNVNDAEELLELGHTFTNVGDLHVIRIARFQCNCDGCCGKDDSLSSL